MAIWLPRKAKAVELKGMSPQRKKDKRRDRRQCLICGQYFDGREKTCPSCNKFITDQKRKEGKRS